jgi:hypothetical protein
VALCYIRAGGATASGLLTTILDSTFEANRAYGSSYSNGGGAVYLGMQTTNPYSGAVQTVINGCRFLDQRDLCGNLFKPSEKAISRGGDRLCRRPPPPPRQGRMLVVSWIMTRVRIWENIELSVGFRGCCE